MIQKLNEIQEVYNCVLGDVVYISKPGGIFDENDQIRINKPLDDFYWYNKKGFLKSGGQIYVLKDYTIIDEFSSQLSIYPFNEHTYLKYRQEANERFMAFYKDNVFKWELKLDFFTKYFDEEYYVYTRKLIRPSVFFVNEMNSFNLLWQYETPAGFTIEGNVFFSHGILVVPILNRNEALNRLIGFDPITGNILWQLNDSMNYYQNWGSSGTYASFAAVREGRNKLQLIDVKKGKIILSKCIDNFNQDVKASLNVIDGDNLYFNITNNDGCGFGAIDLKTQEIKFIQNLQLRAGDFIRDKMQYSNGKLFMVTHSKAVHIYQV